MDKLKHSMLWATIVAGIVEDNALSLSNHLHSMVNSEDLAQLINDRNTVLHLAAMGSGPEIVAALLDAGADPTVKNDSGQTPLDVASRDDIRNLLTHAAAAQKQASDYLQSISMSHMDWASRVKKDIQSPSKDNIIQKT